jgi:hypothetical protein
MSILRDLALTIPQVRRLYEERNALIAQKNEFSGNNGSPFFHYNTTFDPQAITRRHAAQGLKRHSDYLTNFLGVLIDPKFFPAILGDKAGQIEGLPIPANWHADIAEWGAALRAVDLASGAFTVIELGCGWGCWMNNTGVAARRAGLHTHLVGVEGDAGHMCWRRRESAHRWRRPCPQAAAALFAGTSV